MTRPADPLAHRAHWPPNVPFELDPGEQTLWQVLAERAAREPHAIALHYLGREWRWDELVASAEVLAGALQRRGVQPGGRVILFMQNCPQFVVAFYAVMRCGAAAVPVNPMNKADELGHYITDAGAGVAIAAADIAGELAEASDRLSSGRGLTHLIVFHMAEGLRAEDAGRPPEGWPAGWRTWFTTTCALPALAHGETLDWSVLTSEGATLPPLSAGADDLALLPYTSGTTGTPKGCVHTHRTLAHNALASGDWYDMRAGDKVLVVVPLFHITGLVMGLLAAVRLGCSIVLLPRWDRRQAALAIAQQRVTHWPNIPTMVIDLLGAPEIDPEALASLRYIGGGGAAMPEAVADRLQAQFGLSYVEGYGLTETAAPTHTNTCQSPRRQCLGMPWVSTEARVVEPATAIPLPVGEVGEILVRGPQLFHGYWNNPQATAEAFVEIDGRRFFRTGDLGRVDADGYFYLADRLKRMINASGFKVWPAEVENLLHRHPDVQEACVIARRDPYRGETVKAVLVPRAGRPVPDAQAVVEWARVHMAAYKVPREVEFVSTLPRSASGKVLWRVLQDRQNERDRAAAEPTPSECAAPSES